MLVFISVVLWLVVFWCCLAIFAVPDPKKANRPFPENTRFPKTFKEWGAVIIPSSFGIFLMIMHDSNPELLGRIYCYAALVIIVLWGIAVVFFGANPWKK